MMVRRLCYETLEERMLFTGADPTAEEQWMLELVNRARLDPFGEVVRNADVGDLNQGLPPGSITSVPKQPIAFNLKLIDAARRHNLWMLSSGIFTHQGENGSSESDRVASAGYAPSGTFIVGENLAFSGATGTLNVPLLVQREHDDLFKDPAHRLILMDSTFDEVGIAVHVGAFQGFNGVMTTQDYATRSSKPFLTGVVFNDAVSADRFYTVGEGLGSISVSTRRLSDGVISSATTFDSGGYQIELDPGEYEVQFSGPGLSGAIAETVNVESENIKLDLNTTLIAKLSLSVDTTFLREPAGTATAVVKRESSDISAPLLVTLRSNRTTEAAVPATVLIGANQTSASFAITAVDDSVIDLTQNSMITASAPNAQQASIEVQTIDDDGPSRWQNQRNSSDVDDDGSVAPNDVLLLINRLKRFGTGLAPNTPLNPPRYFDVSGDWFIAPVDVLQVINTLNRQGRGSGEGESQPNMDQVAVDWTTTDEVWARVGHRRASTIRRW
ncbi:MAG: dockerin type I domain-containing protein [Pirellulaceae bacterium]|nr:dockerin type I domain-containing protein [Pirellulaceae bacterium]